MKKAIIRYIISRLTEASTIRGIILSVGSVVGYNLNVDQTDSLVWVVLGLVGFVGTFIPDLMTKPKVETVQSVEDTDNVPPTDTKRVKTPLPQIVYNKPVPPGGYGDRD